MNQKLSLEVIHLAFASPKTPDVFNELWEAFLGVYNPLQAESELALNHIASAPVEHLIRVYGLRVDILRGRRARMFGDKDALLALKEKDGEEEAKVLLFVDEHWTGTIILDATLSSVIAFFYFHRTSLVPLASTR